MRKGLKASQINEKNLALHAIAFLLYIGSLILDEIYFFRYNWAGEHNFAKVPTFYLQYIRVQAASMVINFVGQLMLCKIFFDFSKPMERRVKSGAHGSIRSSAMLDSTINSADDDRDEREAELKARIWN